MFGGIGHFARTKILTAETAFGVRFEVVVRPRNSGLVQRARIQRTLVLVAIGALAGHR